ncbi:MAG TPA: hypothetical protein VMV16_10040 [Solirubrobacteraceae bacterium]|nr:hypothetical protein [Solirubrobacteraceae bacterium]
MKNIRLTWIVVLGVLVLGAGVAACGGSGSAPATRSAQLDQGDRGFLAFTRCMRQHGVQMGDPYHRAGHSGLTLDMPAKTPVMIRAYGRCGHIIASIIAMKEAGMRARQSATGYRQATATHLGLLHYARCMRSHGIPMLDPDQNGNLDLGNVPGIASVGRYTPLFRRADHTCRTLLPSGVRDNGTGP